EVALYFAVSVDVGFGDFPIVDTGIARRARVAQNDALIEVVEIHWYRDAPHARGSQLDGADAAIKRRVVILHARWNADDLRFHVLRDFADLLRAMAGAGESVERARARDHECRRSGDDRTRGSFGIRLHREAGGRPKEAQEVSRQRQTR